MHRLIYSLDPALLNLRRLQRLIYSLDHAFNLQRLERLIYSLGHALIYSAWSAYFTASVMRRKKLDFLSLHKNSGFQ